MQVDLYLQVHLAPAVWSPVWLPSSSSVSRNRLNSVHCTVKLYTLLHSTSVHFSEYHTWIKYNCTLNHRCTAACIKWTIAAVPVSRNRTHQLLHLPPSTPLNQDTLTTYTVFLCISTVFVFLSQNFVALMCIHSTDVHHPESEPSIWHFHGFQVIANWRLAQIARALGLLQKSKH